MVQPASGEAEVFDGDDFNGRFFGLTRASLIGSVIASGTWPECHSFGQKRSQIAATKNQ
jgi:hypothetical protein